mmetsp:Transcript_17351/g.28005  ORF Transcript_17351/g.28005 Transcript_17351/m.28005 type:complete len:486 (-) Transcript_17351:198-1655(-)|eukprot:CAMPEP_0203745252 /NCGR_PEP_ID=MMETSP0098-20131031/1053_1 /ASSEMBLY_ACC=CAM_ASM_000208 /TAXON_ID=96639 /ORGANISM=" , Strain NY0313808BC1" /LENGTH=485 /DNA_ID=CAMNT_0050632987 /DNA_START=213 /DNA_END=1670 /DNA_ORIENTATION=-
MSNGKEMSVIPQDTGDAVINQLDHSGHMRRIRSSQNGMKVFQDELVNGDSVHDYAPERKLGWKTTGMIQIGDVVGMGILTIATAFTQLGWVLAVLFLTLMCPVNVYMGVVLSKAQKIIPAAFTYEQMARFAVMKKWFTIFVEMTFFLYLILTLGGYILALTEALQMVFFESSLCAPIFGVISVGILVFPVQIRTLSELKILVWINFCLITSSVLMAAIYMAINMDAHHIKYPAVTDIFPSHLTWTEFFNGISKVTFAYLGAYIYLEIMSEMQQPGDFPKAFIISAPFQYGMYIFVGSVGYLYNGEVTSDIILKEVSPVTNPGTFRAAAILLALHLVISYCIKGICLCRSIHAKISPETVNDFSRRGRIIWMALSLSILASSYIFSNAIPLFDKMSSLLGALFAPLLGYIFPPIFLLFARRRAGVATSTMEYIVIGSIVVFALILLFVGTVANVISFIDAMKAQSQVPFQCKSISYLDEYMHEHAA